MLALMVFKSLIIQLHKLIGIAGGIEELDKIVECHHAGCCVDVGVKTDFIDMFKILI